MNTEKMVVLAVCSLLTAHLAGAAEDKNYRINVENSQFFIAEKSSGRLSVPQTIKQKVSEKVLEGIAKQLANKLFKQKENE